VRPTVYTQEQAAARMGVARRTIRDWEHRGWLTALPATRQALGYPLYAGPALVAAEKQAKAGRRVRRSALAP
jgi:DNA-binding transcriptional MerR regulator